MIYARCQRTTDVAPVRSSPVRGASVQRSCACGQHAGGDSDCEECSKERLALQRSAHLAYGGYGRQAPGIVHGVLQSGGHPLDPQTRAYFEPRLGKVVGEARPPAGSRLPQELQVSQPGDPDEQEAERVADAIAGPGAVSEPSPGQPGSGPRYDLSHIRVHADERAARSARAVDALAFTVDRHIVFGSGFYPPRSRAGLNLLAHELVHATQQAGGVLRRAPAPAPQGRPTKPFSVGGCLEPLICATVTTPSRLLELAGAESRTRRQERRKKCGPPETSDCRGDGHAERAVQTESVINAYDPYRLRNVEGIFVDKDLERDFGAATGPCSAFTPPLKASGFCITIPEKMEKNAAEFNQSPQPSTGGEEPTIDGKEPRLWRELTIEVISHEAGHADFRTAFEHQSFVEKLALWTPYIMDKKRPTCMPGERSKLDVHNSANELAAMLQEYPVRREFADVDLRLQPRWRESFMNQWRDRRILPNRQSITNSLRVIRCLCGCEDADDLIRETIAFATSTWAPGEKADLHREMNDPRWERFKFRWPFAK